MQKDFVPYHIDATPEDFLGNNQIGRYIFLPGSDERAKEIASNFTNLKIKHHSRGHHLYLGEIKDGDHEIKVASISTGMGCPSIDIILHELYLLGGRRFLRVGTAGSLQPDQVKTGDIVIATAAVRDEDTTDAYVTRDFPAVASLTIVNAALKAAIKYPNHKFHAGIVHTKSAFYAREMKESHLVLNSEYMMNLKHAGVLASEMECSHLFVLGNLFNAKLRSDVMHEAVLAGAILGIVGDKTPISDDKDLIAKTTDRLIEFAIETVKVLDKCRVD